MSVEATMSRCDHCSAKVEHAEGVWDGYCDTCFSRFAAEAGALGCTECSAPPPHEQGKCRECYWRRVTPPAVSRQAIYREVNAWCWKDSDRCAGPRDATIESICPWCQGPIDCGLGVPSKVWRINRLGVDIHGMCGVGIVLGNRP
jgi:hypothetical protein